MLKPSRACCACSEEAKPTCSSSPPTAQQIILEQFQQYLRQERGLAEGTTTKYTPGSSPPIDRSRLRHLAPPKSWVKCAYWVSVTPVERLKISSRRPSQPSRRSMRRTLEPFNSIHFSWRVALCK